MPHTISCCLYKVPWVIFHSAPPFTVFRPPKIQSWKKWRRDLALCSAQADTDVWWLFGGTSHLHLRQWSAKKTKIPERARTHRVCSNSSAKCRTAEAAPLCWDENVPQPAEGFGLALMFIFVAVWFIGGFALRHGNRIYASSCPPTFSLTSVASPLLPWALKLFIPTVRSSPATAAIPSPVARLHPLYLHLISIRCCPICDSGHFVFTVKSSLDFTLCAPFPIDIPPFMSFYCLAHFWSSIIQGGARQEERNRLVT